MVFLHIGYHKTASTWLQQQIFPKHPSIAYWATQRPEYAWLPEAARVHDFAFDAQKCQALYKELRTKPTPGPVVVSWEGFVGDPFSGAQTSMRNAVRLHSIFPDAQILVVIRNQLDMLDSLYRQYIQEGGTCSLERLLNLGPRNRVYFSMDYLRYDLLIDHYRALFGHQSVHVFLYEDLARSPSEFLDRLFFIIGVEQMSYDKEVLEKKPNQSLSSPALYLLRLVNHLLSSALNPGALLANRWLTSYKIRRWLQTRLDPLVPDRPALRGSYISPELALRLRSEFKHCNRFLVDETGVPLSEYGYPL